MPIEKCWLLDWHVDGQEVSGCSCACVLSTCVGVCMCFECMYCGWVCVHRLITIRNWIGNAIRILLVYDVL